MVALGKTRSLPWLVAGATLVLVACGVRDAGSRGGIPGIDADASAVTQTATFALG